MTPVASIRYNLLVSVAAIAALPPGHAAIPNTLLVTATVVTNEKLLVASNFHAHPSPAAHIYRLPS